MITYTATLAAFYAMMQAGMPLNYALSIVFAIGAVYITVKGVTE